MDWAGLLRTVGPLLAAVLAGGVGGGTLGYQERDADFERVVAKYRAAKHELSRCVAFEPEALDE